MSNVQSKPITEEWEDLLNGLDALSVSGSNEGIQKTGPFTFANKNFTSGYVPYIGATSNLNLGTYNISAGIGTFGGSSSGQSIIASGLVVNNGSGALVTDDFQVKGATDANTFYVDTSANSVGIGTTSPGAKLHVYGSDNLLAQFESTGNTQLVVKSNNASTGANAGIYLKDGGTTLGGFLAYLNSHSTLPNQIWFKNYNANGSINFAAGGGSSSNLTILNGGNVGIGTTSPKTLLQLGTSTYTGTGIGDFLRVSNATNPYLTTEANGKQMAIGYDTTDDYGRIKAHNYSGGDDLDILLGTSETLGFMFKSTGKLGIGLTSPTAYLHIKAGTATASTAPIKLTSGTVNTTAEAGALEYNGTNLSFVPTGTLRENVHTGGRGNVTLTAGTTTTVTDATAKTTSTIIISPTSLAVIALTPYVSTKNNGSFVITTLAAAGTETLDYLIVN